MRMVDNVPHEPNSSPYPAQRLCLLLAVVGSLYIMQGVPMGLSMVVVPTLMRQWGLQLESLSLASLALMPWALKFLWAPFVDNTGRGRFGRRKSWIMPLQLALSLLLVIIGLFCMEAHAVWWLIGLVTFANLLAATQDIAIDGLAVENLATLAGDRYVGWANAFQVGGFAAGMCIGGPLILIGSQWLPLSVTMVLLALLVAAALVPTLIWHDPPAEAREVRPRASLKRFFSKPNAWLMLVVAALFNAHQMMASSLLNPFLVDSGAAAGLIGIVSGFGILLIAVGSSVFSGLSIARFGLWRTAVVAMSLACIAAMGWIVAAGTSSTSAGVVLGISAATGIFSGVAYVAFFSIFMRWSRGNQAGTDFTAFQCAESCGAVILTSLGSIVAGQFGYVAAFLLSAIIGVLAVMIVCTSASRLDGPSGGDEAEGIREWPDEVATKAGAA